MVIARLSSKNRSFNTKSELAFAFSILAE